jgi:hypothetical protein
MDKIAFYYELGYRTMMEKLAQLSPELETLENLEQFQEAMREVNQPYEQLSRRAILARLRKKYGKLRGFDAKNKLAKKSLESNVPVPQVADVPAPRVTISDLRDMYDERFGRTTPTTSSPQISAGKTNQSKQPSALSQVLAGVKSTGSEIANIYKALLGMGPEDLKYLEALKGVYGKAGLPAKILAPTLPLAVLGGAGYGTYKATRKKSKAERLRELLGLD